MMRSSGVVAGIGGAAWLLPAFASDADDSTVVACTGLALAVGSGLYGAFERQPVALVGVLAGAAMAGAGLLLGNRRTGGSEEPLPPCPPGFQGTVRAGDSGACDLGDWGIPSDVEGNSSGSGGYSGDF